MGKFNKELAGKRSKHVALEDCKIGFMVYKKDEKIKNKHIDEGLEREIISIIEKKK